MRNRDQPAPTVPGIAAPGGEKKDGTNGRAVRAGRPVTQLTSSTGAIGVSSPSPEYIHHSIDSGESKYKNLNYFPRLESVRFRSVLRLKSRSPWDEEMQEKLLPRLDKVMTKSMESSTSTDSLSAAGRPSGWLKLGVVAAATVLAGSLAAAWWYRNTVKRLRQADENPSHSHFGIHEDDPEDG
jgi:hypothetical protein